MSVPAHLEEISELLVGVLRRQDELEARFRRLEASLGLEAAQQLAPPPDTLAPPPVTSPFTPAQQAPLAATRATAAPADKPTFESQVELPWQAPLAATRATAAPTDKPTFESQVGLQWLNRIGVITLMLGVAFAFKTAVDNNWIGPGARVGLGVAAALATLAIGDLQWRRHHVVFAQGLTGLGMALLYLSFWASFALYDLVPQPIAFGLMIATTIVSGLLALCYASQAIAVLALVGGYVTPIAMATGAPHAIIFLSYVTLLNLTTIVLARRRVWPILELLAAGATAILYAGWLGSVPAATVERPIATVFAGVFYVQYAVGRSRIPWAFGQLAAPLLMALLWDEPGLRTALLLAFAGAGLAVAERRRITGAALWSALWFWLPVLLSAVCHRPSIAIELAGTTLGFASFLAWVLRSHLRLRRPLSGPDLAILVGNPAAYFAAVAVVLEPAHHVYLGVLALVLTAVYLAIGRLIWNAASAAADRGPAYLTLGIALACFTAAIPLELGGLWIAIAWAIEGAGLAWLSRRLADAKLGAAACGVLALALVALCAYAPDEAPLTVVANLRFAAFAVLAASLFAAARLLRDAPRALAAYVVAHVLVLIAIGLELAGWIARAIASWASCSWRSSCSSSTATTSGRSAVASRSPRSSRSASCCSACRTCTRAIAR